MTVKCQMTKRTHFHNIYDKWQLMNFTFYSEVH